MIDPTVRPANRDDAGEIAWLEEIARASLADQRGGDRWLATHPPHRGRPGTGAAAWVATIDVVVVGYLVCSFEREPDQPGATGSATPTLARVLDVFVHPDARDVGFGDELLAAAIDAARDAGAPLLEAEALPGDRATKNLYERAGIKARLITVSTAL